MPKLIIEELILVNFKQHHNLHERFMRKNLDGTSVPAGLIGLIGDNGSGKTTILDGLRFCFLGQVPGDTKEELISWGDPPPKGYARCIFRVDDEPAEIYRELHSSIAVLTLRGKTYKGITSVNREIEEQLGLDKELCEQNIFVGQSEIADILFTEPAKRRRAWQKLVGMGKAEDMYSVLGTFLSGVSVTEVPEEDMVRAKMVILDTRKQVLALGRKLADMKKWGHDVDVAGLQGIVSNCKMIMEFRAKYDAWQLETSKAKTASDNAAYDWAAAKQNALDLRREYVTLGFAAVTSMDTMLIRSQYLKTEIQKAEWAAKAYAELDGVAGELESVSTTLMGFDKARLDNLDKTSTPKQLADVQTDIGGHISSRQTCEDLLRAISGISATPVCPVCDQPILNMGQLKARLAERLEAMKLKINELQRMQSVLQQGLRNEQQEKYSLHTEFTRLMARLDALTKRKDELVPQLEGLVLAPVLAGMKAELAEADAKIIKERDIRLKMVAAEEKEGYLAKAADLATRTYDRLAATAYPVPSETEVQNAPAAQREAQQKLDGYARMQREMAELAGQLKATRQSVRTAIGQLRALYQRRANDARKSEARKVLEDVRGFFHHTQGPLLVVAKILEDVTPGVNGFLRYFNAPYTVVPDFENIMFRCVFTDGRNSPAVPPPATKLSGGEKIALALAFRFATYYSLSSQMGFMTLDEPTIHLDKKNIDNFASLMERVKTLTRDSGIQIVVSTHDEGVISVLDHVTDLRKKVSQKAKQENSDE